MNQERLQFENIDPAINSDDDFEEENEKYEQTSTEKQEEKLDRVLEGDDKNWHLNYIEKFYDQNMRTTLLRL